MHAVETKLIQATKIRLRKSYKDRQEYLKAILIAVANLDQDAYDNLTDDAATWSNEAVKIYNTDKSGELPDFDEVHYENGQATEDDEGQDEQSAGSAAASGNSGVDDSDDDSGDADTVDDEDIDDDEETDEPAPKVKAKPAKAAPEKAVKQKPPTADAVLDKWGCIEGSKNGMALALFEQGATSREVKDQLDGGTYYNILKKMIERGHTVEKDGAVIKLIHKDEVGGKALPARKPKK